jgi:hypothetical protein
VRLYARSNAAFVAASEEIEKNTTRMRTIARSFASSVAASEEIDKNTARLRSNAGSSASSFAVAETCTSPAVQGNQPAEHHKSCDSRHPAVEDIKDMPNTLTKEIVSNV